jgi:4a-hydroxytetrahydrobiopterin dehydratase
MTTTCDLTTKHCKPCEGGVDPMTADQISTMLAELKGWKFYDKQIFKTFKFKNYHQTMAFVNATAEISHGEDHHPDLEVHYDNCKVTYWTHAIDGLSENDFICAAKVDSINI